MRVIERAARTRGVDTILSDLRWRKTKTRARGPRFQFKSFKTGSARSARTCARATTTASATTVATGTGAEHRLGLHRQQAFALQLLAGQLARAAHGFGLFTGLLFGGLFVVPAELHLAENTLALHLLLQRLEGLIDIVIADENLHAASSFNWSDRNSGKVKVRRKACP